MRYTEFEAEVSHQGRKQLLVKSVFSIGGASPFAEGDTIIDTENFRYSNINRLGMIDGRLTGLSDYDFYLIICGNGTTLIVQDLLGDSDDSKIIEDNINND